MNKSNTLSIFIAVRNVFFLQTIIGISANIFLLLFHILTFLVQSRLKPTDLTIAHLALIHVLMLIIRALLDMDSAGVQDLLDEITCKAVMYLYRLMRSLSLCTTCLLGVLQAVTLSPRSSFLTKLKHTSPTHSLCCFLMLWGFNIVINVRVLVSVGGPTNETSAFWFTSESCSVSPTAIYFRTLFTLIGSLRDIFFIGLMALSSGYTVALLWTHKRQCQHLHSTSLAPKASPELRATRAILRLLGFFVVMYVMDSITSSFLGKMQKKDPARFVLQMLVANGYATISPLMLIRNEKRILKLFQATVVKLRECLCSAG